MVSIYEISTEILYPYRTHLLNVHHFMDNSNEKSYVISFRIIFSHSFIINQNVIR